MNSMIRQKDMMPEDKPPPPTKSTMLLGKSRGQLLIAPERMRPLDQRLVMKVKDEAVKNNTA